MQYTRDFCIFSLENRNTSESRENHKTVDMLAGVRRQSKVECSTGVRPQSKVAGDCTLAPDPGGCALSEVLELWARKELRARKEEGGTRKEPCSRSEE